MPILDMFYEQEAEEGNNLVYEPEAEATPVRFAFAMWLEYSDYVRAEEVPQYEGLVDSDSAEHAMQCFLEERPEWDDEDSRNDLHDFCLALGDLYNQDDLDDFDDGEDSDEDKEADTYVAEMTAS